MHVCRGDERSRSRRATAQGEYMIPRITDLQDSAPRLDEHGIRFAWITGAHGFIGRYLARIACSQGVLVAGIGHGAWASREALRDGVRYWLNSDITVSSLIHLAQLSGLPDVVFHLAGGSSVAMAAANPLEDFHRTVVATANLLEWLRQHSPETRLVAVSSAAVYGAGHEGPISETAHMSPVSPYGFHKLMMEESCRSYATSYGLRTVIPRPFSVYGPGLRKQLLWDLCEKMRAGREVELGGTGEERRDWVHVSDLALCLIRVAQRAQCTAPVVNVGTGVSSSVRAIVERFARVWARDAADVPIVFSGRSRPGDPVSLVPNVDRMRSWGLKPSVTVADGVEEYIEWYRSNNG